MTEGVKIRAEIDNETHKALLLMNGGSATAVLAFISQTFGKAGFAHFVKFSLWSLAAFLTGVACAVIHNLLRRKCSLVYEQNNMRPPAGKFLWMKLKAPGVCAASYLFTCISIAMFCVGGALIVAGGLTTPEANLPSTEVGDAKGLSSKKENVNALDAKSGSDSRLPAAVESTTTKAK